MSEAHFSAAATFWQQFDELRRDAGDPKAGPICTAALELLDEDVPDSTIRTWFDPGRRHVPRSDYSEERFMAVVTILYVLSRRLPAKAGVRLPDNVRADWLTLLRAAQLKNRSTSGPARTEPARRPSAATQPASTPPRLHSRHERFRPRPRVIGLVATSVLVLAVSAAASPIAPTTGTNAVAAYDTQFRAHAVHHRGPPSYFDLFDISKDERSAVLRFKVNGGEVLTRWNKDGYSTQRRIDLPVSGARIEFQACTGEFKPRKVYIDECGDWAAATTNP